MAQLTETAAGDGLEFHFDTARGGNTFDAHRLVHLALAHGLQDAMKERLMRAYLTEGELISDHPTLRRLALEVGLPRPRSTSSSRASATQEVRTDEYTANRLGITAVPFFVVDRAYRRRRRPAARIPAGDAPPRLGGPRARCRPPPAARAATSTAADPRSPIIRFADTVDWPRSTVAHAGLKLRICLLGAPLARRPLRRAPSPQAGPTSRRSRNDPADTDGPARSRARPGSPAATC